MSEVSLTYDHIIPKSIWNRKQGSPTTWTNIVTACVKCNNKKGNRTPEQAKMKLLNHPYIPTKHTKYLPITHFLSRIRDDIPSEWSMYLNTK
jgi:5-methylcytosine-specific restriction endonuclease McrA